MPERVATFGRQAHMQWLGTSLQPAQRSPLGPPRAKKGLALRARRAERRRATAWGMPQAYVTTCRVCPLECLEDPLKDFEP